MLHVSKTSFVIQTESDPFRTRARSSPTINQPIARQSHGEESTSNLCKVRGVG